MNSEEKLLEAVAVLAAAEGRAAACCDMCNAARSLAVEIARTNVIRHARSLAHELQDALVEAS